MAKIVFGTARKITGQSPDKDFVISTANQAATEAEVLQDVLSDRDTVFQLTLAGRTLTDVKITAPGLGQNGGIESLTPDACEVIDGSTVRAVDSTKTCLIAVRGRTGTRQVLVTPVADKKKGTTKRVALDHVIGSLAKETADNLYALFPVGTAAGPAAQDLYVNATYSTTPGACSGSRNPNVSLKLNGISFCSGAGWGLPVVLIGPRHILFAAHINATGNIVFMRDDGSFTGATIVATALVAGSTDLKVGYLSTDVTGVTPARTLPTDFYKYLPSMVDDWTGQSIEGKTLDFDWPSIGGVQVFANPGATVAGKPYTPINTQSPHMRPVGRVRQAIKDGAYLYRYGGLPGADWQPLGGHMESMWAIPYGGDSGGPTYMLLGKTTVEPVLVSVTYTGSVSATEYAPSGADFIPEFVSAINTTMQTLASAQGDVNAATYQIQTVDLSSYPRYV